VGPRAGLDKCGKCGPTRIRSPDRTTRSQSLYRLSYPARSGVKPQGDFCGHSLGKRARLMRHGITLRQNTDTIENNPINASP